MRSCDALNRGSGAELRDRVRTETLSFIVFVKSAPFVAALGSSAADAVPQVVRKDARQPTGYGAVRKDARLSTGYGPRLQVYSSAREAAGRDRQLMLSHSESNGDRQVAGLIVVMSILSPALV
jgi:hypothetical protein